MARSLARERVAGKHRDDAPLYVRLHGIDAAVQLEPCRQFAVGEGVSLSVVLVELRRQHAVVAAHGEYLVEDVAKRRIGRSSVGAVCVSARAGEERKAMNRSTSVSGRPALFFSVV